MILEALDLTVRYSRGAPAALDGVSCRVAAKELVAVVGPNGSGKSTLVRALSGLVPAERGVVRIQGRALAEWSRAELARAVGVVAQREEILFPLRVEEAVMLGPLCPARTAGGARCGRPRRGGGRARSL